MKYELTDVTMEYKGCTLHRIRALKDFSYVKAGELGGWVESENNLSQEGDAWVYNDSKVCDNALIQSDDDLLCVGYIGPEHKAITFFVGSDGFIHVHCDGFTGILDEFTANVKREHVDDKFAREYSAAIELAKTHIILPK